MLGQYLPRDAGLHAGKASSDAHVRPLPKAEVAAEPFSLGLEGVAVRKHLLVTISARQRHQAKPGLGKDVIAAFGEVSPSVHEEPGCELYAAHLEQGGDTVVMVERWAGPEALQAHNTGPALVRLGGLIRDLLAKPFEVWLLDPVALGDERKGVIPS